MVLGCGFDEFKLRNTEVMLLTEVRPHPETFTADPRGITKLGICNCMACTDASKIIRLEVYKAKVQIRKLYIDTQKHINNADQNFEY